MIPSHPTATFAARLSSGALVESIVFNSPDGRTTVKDCTKSETVPHRGLVPWVAVATAAPIEHSVRKGSDGSERPDPARRRVKSPMRTPPSTVTLLVTGSNLRTRLRPLSG